MIKIMSLLSLLGLFSQTDLSGLPELLSGTGIDVRLRDMQ